MHILLTNDDGLQAQGLQILKEEIMDYARKVTVVAPAGQRSAASHSMNIPVRRTRYGKYPFPVRL